jgi:aspartate-semialdehyde dehydrogenase
MGYRVAVVGATGAVGRELLAVLEEVNFPIDQIHAVASRASIGTEVSFGDRIVRCEDFDRFDFSKVDLVLMSVGADLSRAHAERIGKTGAVVIDNSSAWRMHPEVPLVVPEVNPDAVDGFGAKNIIANPNCSTIQLVVALKPLHDEARIKRVVVSTYQSVSGAGKEGMDELWTQTKGVFVLGAPEPKHFTKQIAFNLIPHIDDFLEDGSTKEEWKMAAETKKILDPSISSPPPACACRSSWAIRRR